MRSQCCACIAVVIYLARGSMAGTLVCWKFLCERPHGRFFLAAQCGLYHSLVMRCALQLSDVFWLLRYLWLTVDVFVLLCTVCAKRSAQRVAPAGCVSK